jgi:hypothetical protein
LDIARLRHDDWSDLLPLFISILRPSDAAGPPADLGRYQRCLPVVAQQRANGTALGTISDALIDLVFGGHHDWYQHDPDWILPEVAAVLDDAGVQQAEIIDGLQAITGAVDDGERGIAVSGFEALMARYVIAWEGLAAADDVTERIAALRAAKLAELFSELAEAGWDPDAPSESMPSREQVAEALDRQVEQLITGDVSS